MKKTFLVLAAAAFFASCGDNADTDDNMADTAMMMEAPAAETAPMTNDAMMHDGMMMMKDGKMMMMKDGQMMAMDHDMKMDNGTMVMMNGEVMHADGMKHQMSDGMMVDAEGNIMNADGTMMPHEEMK